MQRKLAFLGGSNEFMYSCFIWPQDKCSYFRIYFLIVCIVIFSAFLCPHLKKIKIRHSRCIAIKTTLTCSSMMLAGQRLSKENFPTLNAIVNASWMWHWFEWEKCLIVAMRSRLLPKPTEYLFIESCNPAMRVKLTTKPPIY